MQWFYKSFTYGTGITQREVNQRNLTPLTATRNGVSGTLVHKFYNDPGDPSRAMHIYNAIEDVNPTSPGKIVNSLRLWVFDVLNEATLGTNQGFEIQYVNSTSITRQNYTWSRSGSNNLYISATVNTSDAGTANAIASRTEQTVDDYGNPTVVKQYDFGNTTTPTKTYTYTYLDPTTTSPYRLYGVLTYMRNRLLKATLNGADLVSNAYDAYAENPPFTKAMASLGVTKEHNGVYDTSFIVRGNVTQSNSNGVTRSMSYDTGGNVVQTADNAGHVGTALIDTLNAVAPILIMPNGNANLSTTLGYDSYVDTTSVSSPNGSATQTDYDSARRPTYKAYANGSAVSYQYNFSGSSGHTIVSVTSGSGTPVWSRATLDGLGRTIKLETGPGNTPNGSPTAVVDTLYAACGCTPLGKMNAVSRPHASGATAYFTYYSYDPGRAHDRRGRGRDRVQAEWLRCEHGQLCGQ